MKFDIKIDLDKVVLIGENSRFRIKYPSEIQTKWLLIKGIDDKIFCLRTEETERKDEFVKNIIDSPYEIIDLEKRIRAKTKYSIDNELKKILKEGHDYILDFEIEENIDTETGEIKNTKIYNMLTDGNARIFGKNIRDDDYRTKYMNLDISEIDKGIIHPFEDKKVKYAILQDKFICEDREVLLAIYNTNEVKQIISYEQYKLGITPPIYNEIAKINNFIEDKNTITVELKNGTKIKTYATLGNILNINEDGKIFIAQTYYQKIIDGEKFERYQYKAEEIKTISFNRTNLDLNVENLMSLDYEKTEEQEETEEM